MKSQEIKIPFDEEDALFFRDRLLGSVETIKNLSFVVDDRLRRVEILRLPFLQDPSAKSDGSTMDVKDGKNDPSSENVIPPLSFPGKDQPQFSRQLQIHLLLLEVLNQTVPNV